MSARVLPFFLLMGCGGLAGADWRGERLFSISGDVLSLEPVDLSGNLRVALFWAWNEDQPVEQSVVVETSFPAHYQLDVYAWPPEEAMFTAPWSNVELAIGVPLLYDDADDDGRYDPGEALVGGPQESGVLYVPPLDDGEVVIDEQLVDGRSEEATLTSGFHAVTNDLQSALCGEVALQPELVRQEVPRTDLYVGPFWIHFTDWNCDQVLTEWTDACPTDPGDPLFVEFCLEQAQLLPDGSYPCADVCAELMDTAP
ncbi:MAG: hypothetical protein H6738_18950 [Alphaproteobacteria bacterium]|nr:hypothetical protein [Alphaproteobacteria bacterium]MCB9698867.1 hypothetical protein [Alphaproteobacteria bacterium]